MTDKRGGKMEKRGGRAAAAEVKRKMFIADAIAKPPSRRTKREREAIAQAIKQWEDDQAQSAAMKSAMPTLEEFLAMAHRGKVRQAGSAVQDLQNILQKKVPAVDFEIGPQHPFSQDYEMGALTKRPEDAGLHVFGDRVGNVFVGTTPENLEALKSAKSALQSGRAYGYPEDDIAAFYLARRGGNPELGYADYSRDYSPFASANSATAALGPAQPGA